MPWPPAPLPVNFANATLSLNTHPTSHNTTNGVINNDIVPKINELEVYASPRMLWAQQTPITPINQPKAAPSLR